MPKLETPSSALSLYRDPETGKTISTNSMLKTFRRCPKQAEYKYYRRLKPKVHSLPLERGKWMHYLLEEFYAGRDWKLKHKQLTNEFAKLFDEEKDKLGDLPRECARLMQGYLWHYKKHSWKVLGTEGLLETELPDGSIFRGKYDLLVEDEFGLWLVDHKNMKTFPNFNFRLLDSQSALYLWAARKNGMPVKGFIWNYLRTKPMTIPKTIQDGSRFSLPTMKNCDYPTALKAVTESGLDIAKYEVWLRNLKKQRYHPDRPQTSEFFQRHVLEKNDAMLDRVAIEHFHTSMRMHEYDFSISDAVERVPDRNCQWMCSYTDLCQTELFGGNTDLILRKQFKEADPMDYYYDEKETTDKDGDR